jgi:hypothetical protein
MIKGGAPFPRRTTCKLVCQPRAGIIAFFQSAEKASAWPMFTMSGFRTLSARYSDE